MNESRTISVDAVTRARAADLGRSLSAVVRRALAEAEPCGPRSVTGVWLDDAAVKRLGELCQADRRHASEVVARAVDELHRRGLQAAVVAWHLEHWPDCPPERIVGKAREELDELEAALANGGSVAEEGADVALVMMALAGRLGFDLLDEMWKKFRINRSRSKERVLR